MTEELGVSDVQAYYQPFHSLGPVYPQFVSAEIHFFPDFFQSRGKAFGDLFMPSSSLVNLISSVSDLHDNVTLGVIRRALEDMP